MATHSIILACRIPWTKEPFRLQAIGSQRVGHDWTTNTFAGLTLLDQWAVVPSGDYKIVSWFCFRFVCMCAKAQGMSFVHIKTIDRAAVKSTFLVWKIGLGPLWERERGSRGRTDFSRDFSLLLLTSSSGSPDTVALETMHAVGWDFAVSIEGVRNRLCQGARGRGWEHGRQVPSTQKNIMRYLGITGGRVRKC